MCKRLQKTDICAADLKYPMGFFIYVATVFISLFKKPEKLSIAACGVQTSPLSTYLNSSIQRVKPAQEIPARF